MTSDMQQIADADKEKIKISPIFYQGCKKKLINKGLLDLFPSNINNFYEPFCGSGIVSMNTEANNYILNDINIHIVNLINMFKNNSSGKIIERVLYNIKKYELEYSDGKQTSFHNSNKYYDKRLHEIHKEKYIIFRNMYNSNKNDIDLYCLLIYCFCKQMRFNSKDEFNMPCGNGTFNNGTQKSIQQGCEFFSKENVSISNDDYSVILKNNFYKNDFVYLDPPYFGTTATYNENGGWTLEDELNLYKFLQQLNDLGIKWGLSNSFYCKGNENSLLKQWCDENNWNVTHFDIAYTSMGKGNSNNKEVYICNYLNT